MADPADPAPLRPAGPATGSTRAWIGRHALGLLALLVGATSLAVAAILQDELWSSPDHRVTIPLFVGTLVPAVISLVRREPTKVLPIVGLVLASIAVVLGWVLVVGAILLAAAIIAYVMSELM
ncbi:MAG TPA: hypothetical protein VHE35_33175 [Kofleriaceae bacterium]|nr:hypothetical protein [Kofleriaceae bacterium]